MNFLQAQQKLARRRGAASSTLNTATATRYKEALNEAHRQILRMPGLESLRQATLYYGSVAGQSRYYLPAQGVARINSIMDTSNDRKLQHRTRAWLDTAIPDNTSITGTPWAWIPIGLGESAAQPSSAASATSLYVGSTSASDTGTAYVEGLVQNGALYRTASVAMTGVTLANISSAITNWSVITKFYLSTAAVGTVTLYADALGSTSMAQIGPGDTRAQFLTYQLFPTPSATSILYTIDVLRSIPDMANDTDEFLLPVDFEDLLLDKAEMKELRKQDDPNRYAMLREDVRRGEAALVSFVTSHPDWRPQFGGPQAEFSSLGPNYEADTWLR